MNWLAPRICSFNFPSHRSHFLSTFFVQCNHRQLISKALLVRATFPPKNRHKHNSQWRLSTPSPSTLKLPPKLHAHTKVLLPCSVAVELFQTVVCSEWLRHIRVSQINLTTKNLNNWKTKGDCLWLSQQSVNQSRLWLTIDWWFSLPACLSWEREKKKFQPPSTPRTN